MQKKVIPFLDILFSFLLVFICIIMLLKVAKSDNDPSFKPNSIYEIILTWDGDDDFDSWTKDPQDHIVSFNRREGGEGSLFSLNRDSLGANRSNRGQNGELISQKNEEITSLRGFFVGEYCFNVHVYLKSETKPVKVTAKLIKVKPYKEIIVKEKILESSGHEETMFRFFINDKGEISDINELPIKFVTTGNSDG